MSLCEKCLHKTICKMREVGGDATTCIAFVTEPKKVEPSAPNYKAECEHLKAELNVRCKEIADLEEAIEIKNQTIGNLNQTISYLEGQIRAFEFCVSKGGANNETN